MKEFDQVLSEECKKVIQPKNIQSRNGEVELISYTRDGDRKILTALLKKGLEKSGISIGYRDAETYASNLTSNQEEGRKFLLNIFKDLTEFDYLKRYKSLFPEIVCIELENTLEEQLEVIEYIKRL